MPFKKILTEDDSEFLRTKIIYDNVNRPSFMVWVPKFNLNEINSAWPNTPHPAFIINGEERDGFWIGKYPSWFQTTGGLTRAYSMPNRDPAASHTFDEARTVARNKGAGWHLVTNAEWMAVALWSKKLGTQPSGNTNNGKDYLLAAEAGVPGAVANQATLTGSGPDSWYHNCNRDGVADLCGNLWEWTAGYRLNEGKIQVIPDNDAALDDASLQNAGSAAWRELDGNGDYVAPTTNTWGWDYNAANPTANENPNFKLRLGAIVNKQASDTGYGAEKFGSLTSVNNVAVPWRLKALGMFPDGNLADYGANGSATGRGSFYFRNNGERLPLRGGHWSYGANAGLFACFMPSPRSNSNANIGSRLAFVEP